MCNNNKCYVSVLALYIYIYREGDTALEAEAQLYSDNSIDLKIMQVKECKVIRPTK